MLLVLVVALGASLPVHREGVASVGIDARGVVVRRSEEGERPLRALAGREPGEVVDLVRDPTGTAYVAARNGLFVASPDCDVLDRVDFDCGEPPGTPLAVALAGEQRVLLLTDRALCAVETRQFLWSEVELAALEPPLRSLRKLDNGQFEVEGKSGVARFDLERSGVSNWPSVRVLNGELRPDGVRALAFGEKLTLEVPALEGVRWMWREAGRFRWLPLDGEPAHLDLPRPGRQALCVVAFDSTMRASPELRIELDVAFPPTLSKHAVLGGIAAPLLALVLLAATLAWRRERTLRAAWRGLLSASLGCLLGLQLLAALVPHSKGWPFVGFTMYTRVSERDSLSYRHEFMGLTPDGHWRALTPPGGAFGKYENERALQPFIHDADGRRERFLREWNASRPAERLVGIADLCRRRRLTPDGPVDVPRIVMFVHPPEVARALP